MINGWNSVDLQALKSLKMLCFLRLCQWSQQMVMHLEPTRGLTASPVLQVQWQLPVMHRRLPAQNDFPAYGLTLCADSNCFELRGLCLCVCLPNLS